MISIMLVRRVDARAEQDGEIESVDHRARCAVVVQDSATAVSLTEFFPAQKTQNGGTETNG
jgi:hypothetical protein